MEDSHISEGIQSEEKSGNSMSPKLVVGALVIILVVAIVGFGSKNKTNSQSPERTQLTITPDSSKTMGASASSPLSASSYKDNTYSAQGEYVSPGGDEHLQVKVTLKDGLITDAEVTPEATRPNSIKFQGIFASNFKPLVVGKNIDEVKLDKVAGSSLSPKGFNDAIEKIKQQAKV